MSIELQGIGIIIGLLMVAPFLVDTVRGFVKEWEQRNK